MCVALSVFLKLIREIPGLKVTGAIKKHVNIGRVAYFCANTFARPYYYKSFNIDSHLSTSSPSL